MRLALVLRRVAQREVDEAADWYDRQQAGLGSEFIEEVNRVFDQIQAGPERYPLVHEDIRKAKQEAEWPPVGEKGVSSANRSTAHEEPDEDDDGERQAEEQAEQGPFRIARALDRLTYHLRTPQKSCEAMSNRPIGSGLEDDNASAVPNAFRFSDNRTFARNRGRNSPSAWGTGSDRRIGPGIRLPRSRAVRRACCRTLPLSSGSPGRSRARHRPN